MFEKKIGGGDEAGYASEQVPLTIQQYFKVGHKVIHCILCHFDSITTCFGIRSRF